VASIASALLTFPHSEVYLHDYKKYEASIRDIADLLQHSENMFRIKRKEKISNEYLKKKVTAFANNPN
jgi:hypothetical protein